MVIFDKKISIFFFRERLVDENENLIELGSDQTSCHCLLNGGYYPVGQTMEESNRQITENPKKFEENVQKRLKI